MDIYLNQSQGTMDALALAKSDAQIYAMGALNTFFIVSSSVLTILGSLLIIITYNMYKNIQTPLRHIILCISVADLICVLANLTGVFMEPEHNSVEGRDIKCILQSFIGTSSVLSSFLWTIMLALSLYILLVREQDMNVIEKLIHPWFHLICWLIPLAINVVALFYHKLGNSGDATSSGWCWIRLVNIEEEEVNEAILWMFIDGKGIEIFTYIVLLCFYVRIKVHLHEKISKSTRSESGTFMSRGTIKAAIKFDRKIIMVPLILILLRIWGTMRFLFFVVDRQSTLLQKEILISMQAVGDNLQGFTNCVLFCFFTKKVNRQMRDSLYACWEKITNWPSDGENIDERTHLI